RFPFDEYYISEKFEILKINFSPLKNRENIFNGIYQKNITHKELSPQLITNLENLLKKMHQIKMEDNNLSISESPNEEAQLKLLTTSFNSQQSILFHIGHEISGKQDNEIHNVKFDSLYQVEFLHNTGTISIIVGSDSKIYKNEVTKNLIIFINNFIKEME
ncbi:hypothetical protein, partial [Fusobacterium sp. PH5-44]|uniref:hypothetical protein n=1 Tax=unclassified Fusobacterium TaxID=2648384 RepID=UPI003D21DAD5